MTNKIQKMAEEFAKEERLWSENYALQHGLCPDESSMEALASGCCRGFIAGAKAVMTGIILGESSDGVTVTGFRGRGDSDVIEALARSRREADDRLELTKAKLASANGTKDQKSMTNNTHTDWKFEFGTEIEFCFMGKLTNNRCPRCGSSTLIDASGREWCSFVGGLNEPACTWGMEEGI